MIPAASLLGLLALAAGAVGERPIERNAAAEVLVERGGELGIPFEQAARAATSDPSVAYSESGAAAWLESQLAIPDESIGEPPETLKRYLEERKEALEAVVFALERQAPDWGKDELNKDGTVNTPALTPSIRLQSVLLAAALVETREGREIEAERLLEASWSLGRIAAEAPLLIMQLIAARSSGWQAGVLRKLPSSPLRGSIVSRATDPGATCSMRTRPIRNRGNLGTCFPRPTRGKRRRGRRRPRSPPASRSSVPAREPAWTMRASGSWPNGSSSPHRIPWPSRRVTHYREITLPNMVNPVRRAARLAVDRELTLEILRLRLAKEQDAEGRWPARMGNVVSTACPSAEYVYRADARGMEIRFEGATPPPTAQFLLPLSFRSVEANKAKASRDADVPSLDTHTRRRDDRPSMTRHSSSNWWWRETR